MPRSPSRVGGRQAMRLAAKNNWGRPLSSCGPSFKNTASARQRTGSASARCHGWGTVRIDHGGLAAGQNQLAAVVVVEIPFVLDFSDRPLDGNLLYGSFQPNEFTLVHLWIIDQCAPIGVALGPAFDVYELDLRQAKQRFRQRFEFRFADRFSLNEDLEKALIDSEKVEHLAGGTDRRGFVGRGSLAGRRENQRQRDSVNHGASSSSRSSDFRTSGASMSGILDSSSVVADCRRQEPRVT